MTFTGALSYTGITIGEAFCVQCLFQSLCILLQGIHVFRSVLFYVHLIKKSRSMFKFLFGDVVTYNGMMSKSFSANSVSAFNSEFG